MVRCPTELELERFLAGELEAPAAERVRAHASECATCATWVREARADDELLGDLGDLLRGDRETDVPTELADGRYRVIGRLGEGGMGVVWEAEQRSPRRRVALKVLRPGLASPRALARFALEAEVLARLDHPGVARVLEAGAFELGGAERPFFAMELVQGRALDRYADEEHLDLDARLALVARVADAVEHAHQKGVLHRDLKPSNVLVTERGEPRVLDFGVARLVDADEPAGGAHEIVGTLPYLAPEAFAGDPTAVDTRADVYALGALLYALVSGRLPIDVSGVPPAEGVRRVQEVEPPPLGSLDPALRGDVEAIAAKALAKDPARRYASAAALAEDLRRALAHHPVAARPPRAAYVLGRLARRYRAATAFAALAVLALAVGVGVATSQAVRARRAEAAAHAEAARLASINGFLRELLGAADPLDGGLGAGATVRQALDDAERRLAAGAALDPRIEADLRLTLAGAYRGLGELARARAHAARAAELAASTPEIDAGVRARLASEEAALAYHEGDFAAAESGFERALEAWEAAGLALDPRGLAARTHLGAARLERGDRPGAERALQRSLADARAHGALEVAAGALVFLARVHDAGDAGGDPTAARAAIDEALDLFASAGAEDANLAAHAWTHRGVLDAAAGDYAAAAEAAERALAIQERRYGVDHPETANHLTNLGAARMAAGEPEEALGYHLRAIELVRDARKLNLAASCLDKLGRLAESRDLHAEAYELVLELPVFDRGAAGAAMGWAAVAAREGDRDAAAEAYRLIADRMPPDAHPRWAVRARVEVARACERADDVACAAERYAQALALDAGRDADPLHYDKARLYLGQLRKDDAPDEAAALFEGLLADGAEEAGVQELAATHLGWIRLDAGAAEEAARLFELAVAGFTRIVGADAAPVLRSRRNLACALTDLGRTDEARAHFEAAAAALGPDLGATEPRRDAILARFRASGAE